MQMHLSIDSQTRVFWPNEIMPSFDVNVPIKLGTSVNYPYDIYVAEFYLQAKGLQNAKYPLSLSLKNQAAEWRAIIQVSD